MRPSRSLFLEQAFLYRRNPVRLSVVCKQTAVLCSSGSRSLKRHVFSNPRPVHALDVGKELCTMLGCDEWDGGDVGALVGMTESVGSDVAEASHPHRLLTKLWKSAQPSSPIFLLSNARMGVYFSISAHLMLGFRKMAKSDRASGFVNVSPYGHAEVHGFVSSHVHQAAIK